MKQKNIVFKTFLMVFGACLFVWLATSPARTSEELSPGTRAHGEHLIPQVEHVRTCHDILGELKRAHYRKTPIDDALSAKVFETYLDDLDPSRSYFLASDINEFEVYRYRLDDLLKAGDLEPAYVIFNRFQKRENERFNFFLTRLGEGLDDLSFDGSESIEIDRKEAAWPADMNELGELSHLHFKNSVLNLTLADKKPDEIVDTLKKRYQRQLKFIQQTNSEDVFQIFMNSLAQHFDPHTSYFSPRVAEEFDINMNQSLEGIGALLGPEDEYTKIIRLISAGPAEKSGLLKAADRIVGVGQGPEGEIVDVVGWRLDEVVKLIRGPRETIVRLEIIPVDVADDQTKVIAIERNTVKLEEQTAKMEIITTEHKGQATKIAVIDLPTFYLDFQAARAGDRNYRSSTRDVKKFLLELSQTEVQGLVIDLRNNSGGLLQEAIELTGLFIEQGPIVQVRTAGGNIEVLRDPDRGIYYRGPLAILTNRMSASASEILAGAVQDYGRGIVVGESTFGKGTVQSLLKLNRGQLKATIAKFYRITGESTQHKGVTPDIRYPSLYGMDTIGESALTDALPWDTIADVPFKSVSNVTPLMDAVRGRHQQRVHDDPDYTYRLAMIEHLKQMRSKTTLSLNEATRRRERKEIKEWEFTLTNKRRIAKNLEPITKLDEMDSDDDDNDDEESKADPVLIETANILLDYAELSSKRIAQQ
jgi:carboxyl-terminal processing protease